MWFRVDLRLRARALLVLALLIALSCGTVLAALAGARRGQSAIGRLESRTEPATVAVLANTPGFDWTKVEGLPEVEGLTRFVVDYDLRVRGLSSDLLDFPPGDAAGMHTIERPVVYAGRVANPDRADEVDVSRLFVSHQHLGIGDHVVLELPTEAELMNGASGAWHGPVVDARIVGVVESPWFTDGPGSSGSIYPSPGLAKDYPGSVLGDQADRSDQNFVNALIRLKGGEATIPRFRRDLARVTGRTDIDVWDLPAMDHLLQRQITFESWCLLVFAAVALAAALFLAGQTVSRFVEAEAQDLRTAQALGMTRSEAVAAATLGPTLAGVIGALLGVLAAYLASAWFPIGTASFVEPSPGRSFDWLVLGLGAVLTVLVVAAGVAWSARALLARTDVASASHSILTELVTRGGWPVPVVIGTRFALEAGRGRDRVPVRPAIVGAVIGVLGITVAFTVSAAVHDASHDPARFGQTYQGDAFVGENGQDFAPVPRVVRDLEADPHVTGVLPTHSGVVGDPTGRASVTIYSYQDEAKSLPVVLTSGRMPDEPDEIVLAPQSLTDLHTHVGAETTLVGTAGRQRFLVTGAGFVPSGPHNVYSEGGWVTPAGFDRVVKSFTFDLVLVSLPSTAHERAATAAATRFVTTRDRTLQGFEVDPPNPLMAVAELNDVQRLPLLLALFLVVLALGAIGHALASAVRRRSKDLAVLRAFGLTPGQCRRVVVVQSTLLGVIGLVIGLPIGLAVGRIVWSVVATYTPLQYVTPLTGWELPLLVPAVLVAVNALGIWPSHRAARLRPGPLLRGE